MKLTHKDFMKPCTECGGEGRQYKITIRHLQNNKHVFKTYSCSVGKKTRNGRLALTYKEGITIKKIYRWPSQTVFPICSACQGSGYAPQVELIKIECVPDGYELINIVGGYAFFERKGWIFLKSRKLPCPQGIIETYVCEVCDGAGQKECSGEFCVWEPICRLSKCKAFTACPSCHGDHTIKTKLDIKVIKQDGEPFFEVRRVRV